MAGLVGYWKFDDGPGSATTVDSSGNGNTGTLTNINTTTGWVAGKQGYALDFNGTNSVVNAGSAAILDNLAQSSACAWTYRTAPGAADYPLLLDKSTNTSSLDGWNFYLSNYDINHTAGTQSAIGFYSNQSRVREKQNSLSHSAKWEHFCATWDGTDSFNGINLYHNGALIVSAGTAELDLGGALNDAAANLGIGNQVSLQAPTQAFTGRLDNIRLYNRVLSGAEILEIYQSEGGP